MLTYLYSLSLSFSLIGYLLLRTWLYRISLGLTPREVIWSSYPAHLHEPLLALLQKFDIIYRLDDTKSLIPCMLPDERTQLDVSLSLSLLSLSLPSPCTSCTDRCSGT
jgi:hypothetical protein